MSDVAVRPATPADTDAIGQIQAASWQLAFADVLPPSVLAEFTAPQFAEAWRAALAARPSRQHHLLVATEGDQLTGFAVLEPETTKDGERSAMLTEFDVDPQARRRGHGSRLLNAAVDIVGADGATEMHTWLRADDDATRNFLIAAGFAADGAWRERIVPDGTVHEIRLITSLADEDEAAGPNSTPTSPSSTPA